MTPEELRQFIESEAKSPTGQAVLKILALVCDIIADVRKVTGPEVDEKSRRVAIEVIGRVILNPLRAAAGIVPGKTDNDEYR